jgi:hypothetical protein
MTAPWALLNLYGWLGSVLREARMPVGVRHVKAPPPAIKCPRLASHTKRAALTLGPISTPVARLDVPLARAPDADLEVLEGGGRVAVGLAGPKLDGGLWVGLVRRQPRVSV